MILCLLLAALPAGTGHSPSADAGKPHAGPCPHAGPGAPGWLPSAPEPELHPAGPDVQLDAMLSVGRHKERVMGPLCMPTPLPARNRGLQQISGQIASKGSGLPRTCNQNIPSDIPQQALATSILEVGGLQ